MAACTFAVGTADTGATPNTSGAFTPAVGDLLVAFVVASGITSPGTGGTLTSSVGGFTFSQFDLTTYATNANMVYGYVSNAFVSSAASQTVTFDNPSDGATGTVIFVYRVSGMSKSGLTAVRQSNRLPNRPAAGTPSVTFDAACLTGNPTLACVGNSSSPAGVTPPTSWTEPATGDLGYSTPTTGGEVCHRDSGFTGTTITWGSTSASVHGTVAVELDASAVAATPYHPSQRFQQLLAQ